MRFSILTIFFIALATTIFAGTSFGQFRPEGCIKQLPFPKPKKPKTKVYAEMDIMRQAPADSWALQGEELSVYSTSKDQTRNRKKTDSGSTVRVSMNKHLSSRHVLYGDYTLSLLQKLPPAVAQPGSHVRGKIRPKVTRCGSHPCGIK